MTAWEQANRELIAKLLTELEFEELLAPEVDGDDWTLTLGDLTLHYTARRRTMGHARVDADSLYATRGGRRIELPDADMVVAIGAPDLGLGAHRNAVIVNALTGRDVYAVRDRNVFQSFGVHAA
jgi:siderophore synthetase component